MELKWRGLRAHLTEILVEVVYSHKNGILGSGICDEIDMDESE